MSDPSDEKLFICGLTCIAMLVIGSLAYTNGDHSLPIASAVVIGVILGKHLL